MKANKKIIENLNLLLADELTAINQYIVQSEIYSNKGYKKLHDLVKKQAIDEMKHAEKLIERILFLEGTPEVSKVNRVRIGKDLEQQFGNDIESEKEAVIMYNACISMAVKHNDNGTAELLRSILADEEKHLDWLETQLGQMKELGIQNYLGEQVMA
jgi:bacterioferritin